MDGGELARASDPSLHGAVEHLLVVARTRGWRPVRADHSCWLDEANVNNGRARCCACTVCRSRRNLIDYAGGIALPSCSPRTSSQPEPEGEPLLIGHISQVRLRWRPGRGTLPAGTPRGGRLGPDPGHQHGIRRPGGDAGGVLPGWRKKCLHRCGGSTGAALCLPRL